jgi:hypothetical protein
MSQQPEERDLTPQPNRILAEPATVQACRADYEAAANIRQTIAEQEARTR